MRVLVTGGAGFIGSHLVDRLIGEGCAVRVLDNLSTGKEENLPARESRLEFVEGDIASRDTVERCLRETDAVVHLAAVASVQASVDDPIATHRTNFDGTLHLLQGAYEMGVRRFLYASSAAIYGDTRELPVAEHIAPNPLTPYAADKLAGEHYLKYFVAKHGLNASSFRFFNVYGPRQDPSSPYSGVISIFVDRISTDRSVTIYGDGKQTRDFVYVGDVTSVLARALTDNKGAGRCVNIGRGVECSLLELLGTLEELTGRRIGREHAPARHGDILRSCADTRALQAWLETVPATPMEEGLRTLLRHAGVATQP